jgi:nucleoside 2-deoxyribosyltransferase
MTSHVYLAGPMHGETYEEATEWRYEAEDRLGHVGIDTRSPMRGKEFLKNKTILSVEAATFNSPWATHKAIMTRDTNDVLTASAILVNFSQHWANPVSIGTVMEMTLAWHARIPVIVVADKDYFAINHPMLSQTVDFLVPTLDEGIAVAITLLGGSK